MLTSKIEIGYNLKKLPRKLSLQYNLLKHIFDQYVASVNIRKN